MREERRVLNKKVGRLAFLAGLLLILVLVGMDTSSVSAHRNLFSDVEKMEVSEADDAASYVYVTTKPSNEQGILYLANVTAFIGSDAVTSGISNTSGVVTLTDIPFGDVTFVAYAGSDYSQVIANQTVLISVEGQSFDLICDRNYGEASVSWSLIVVASLSALIISLPFLLSGCLISVKENRKTSNNLSKEAGKSQFPRRKTHKKGE